MGNFLVSFELRSDHDYAERYKSLTEQIKAKPTEYHWDETTSFAAIETPETIHELASRLYLDTKVNSQKDILLVIDPATSHCIALGPIRYEVLLSTNFKIYEKK